MKWQTAAAVIWTLVIIALCSIPGDSLPGPDVAGADKLAHLTLFAIFGWLWLNATDSRIRYVLTGGLLLAVLTEMYQDLLPFGRDPSALDALANVVGLAAAISAHRILGRRRSENRSENAVP